MPQMVSKHAGFYFHAEARLGRACQREAALRRAQHRDPIPASDCLFRRPQAGSEPHVRVDETRCLATQGDVHRLAEPASGA